MLDEKKGKMFLSTSHYITGNSIFLSKGFSSTEIKRHIFRKIHENIRPTRKWNLEGG